MTPNLNFKVTVFFYSKIVNDTDGASRCFLRQLSFLKAYLHKLACRLQPLERRMGGAISAGSPLSTPLRAASAWKWTVLTRRTDMKFCMFYRINNVKHHCTDNNLSKLLTTVEHIIHFLLATVYNWQFRQQRCDWMPLLSKQACQHDESLI